MRIAIALSKGHVSPRLDCSDQLILVEAENGVECGRNTVDLQGWPSHGRSTRIVHMGVRRLVCGTVSHFDEAGLNDSHVELITGVAGPLEPVVAAVVSETIASESDFWPSKAIHQRSK